MSKVTAMQELIEKLERYKSNAEEQAKSFDRQNMVTAEMASESMVTAYGVAILAATQLLELEKQQIKDAYQHILNIDGEDYYTETFTKNQQQ